ncbi:hypothetical protein MKX03_012062 [Papaver bracteatum]|nr:hypothetical protein MKX03_012062 [Papaver bracteatum]
MSAVSSARQRDANDSQETILLRSIEALLRKVVESQAQNQLQQTQNQQQMTEMFKMLANNTGVSKTDQNENTGISNDAARKSSVASSGKQISIPTHDEDDTEEDEAPNGSGGCRRLGKGYGISKCGRPSKTLRDIFATRDSGKHIYTILLTLIHYDQIMLLEEFLKVVPPKELEYRNPYIKGLTILHGAAAKGNLRAVKALVKKHSDLTKIRSSDEIPYVPLLTAVNFVTDGQIEVVEYLCSVTRDEDPSPFSGKEGDLLMLCLNKDDIREEVRKVVKDKISESNQQIYVSAYEGYEPLYQAIRQDDWGKAMEYLSVDANQTSLKEIFETRDCREQIHKILLILLLCGPMMLLEKFLGVVPSTALEYRNPSRGNTILHSAAMEGNLRAVKTLVKKNRNLTQIGSTGDTPYVPLVLAADSVSDGQKEVVEYLYSETRDEDPSPFSGKDGALLMKILIAANMYGVVISICERFPETLGLWITDAELSTIIGVLKFLIERPFTFLSGTKLTWWERRIYSVLEVDRESERDGCIDINKQKVESSECIKVDEENPQDNSTKEKSSSPTSNKRTISKCISFYFTRCIRRVPCINKLYHQKLMHIQAVALVKCLLELLHDTKNKKIIKQIFLKYDTLEMAINFRTTEFVLECLRLFPYLGLDEALLRLAVRERNELIYSFMCILRRKGNCEEFSTRDEDWNSILHVTAAVAHNRQLNIVSGAAFQMQREIQWFKAVENTIIVKHRFMRNKKGESAQFLFTEEHKDLMEKSEKWMKELSTSCMVVAALIATVAFAAAITVPGGNISDNDSGENGLPIFLHKKSFMLFAIPNALALFSSVTSVFMFLTVFTSRYSEEDFIKSLPQKIIIGLFTLFISMATMLVAFGAVFAIVVGRGSVWAPIIVSLLGCAPLLLFGSMQFPLFFEMVRSTYRPLIFGKEDNPLLEPYLSKEKKD